MQSWLVCLKSKDRVETCQSLKFLICVVMLGYLKVNIVVSYTDMKTVEIDNYKESLENNRGINNILAII